MRKQIAVSSARYALTASFTFTDGVPMSFARIFAIALVALCTGSALAGPTFSGTWINSAPLKSEGLGGKVVVMYFYEEGCPSCRAKWPGLIEVANQFKEEPVLFIAVNSGNDPKAVESYLKGVNCDWAALADTDRSFERSAGVPTISLQNIYQARIITPAGRLVQANPGDLASAVKSLLPQASWKVDPKIVPESMKPAWKALEYGDYATGMAVVKRTIKSGDEKTRTAAEAMDKAITADIESLMAQAAKAESSGLKWEAYKAYTQVATNFKGHPKATEAATAARKLAAEKELKDEVKAMALLDRAQAMLQSRNRQEKRSAQTMLESIAKQYPDTEAGSTAAKLAATAGEP